MPNTRETIEWLKSIKEKYIHGGDDAFDEKRRQAIDYAVSVLAHGVTVQEWISVKDRLPDRNDMVIAFYPTMRGTSGEMQIHKAWAMSETCTHWMPLPKPPKGE